MTSLTSVDLRDAFADELVSLGQQEPRLVVLDADVSRTTRTRRFRNAHPERFYDVGVAEQNLYGMAAGLASTGCIVVASTLAVFASMRAAEQVRTSICYPRLNVKILAGYAGLSNGKDGATHQSLEDVAIMRSFANLTIITAADAHMARWAVRAAIAHEGPVYIRLEYEPVPLVNPAGLDLRLGSGVCVRSGSHVTLASYGLALHRTLAAADALTQQGIMAEVLDFPTLKPFDAELLLNSARRTGALVTLEDHSIIGGLASIACETLVAGRLLVPFQGLGVQGRFTESGPNDSLRERYGLGVQNVLDAAHAVMAEHQATIKGGA